MKNNRQWFTVLAATGAATLALTPGCGAKKAAKTAIGLKPKIPVEVMAVSTGSISKQISVVGSLSTLYSVDLSSKTSGRLISLSVREGDSVRAGQVVAQVDPTIANAEVQQDQGNLSNAQAKLSEAQVQYTQGITNANVNVSTAKAALASAQATLQKTIEGDQQQAKLQAKDNLIQQQANYQNALSNYNEQKQLFTEGAIAQSDMNNAETTYTTQKALLDNYKQALSIAVEGGRPEDVRAQQEVVAQDQANVTNAVANLATIRVDQDAVTAAQAAVVQAQGQLDSAHRDLADTNIVSPINGYVSARDSDPGQIATAGTAILTVVDLSTVYYQPTISAQDFQNVNEGQLVSVNVDAYPGRVFHGRVAAVYPSASTTDRLFSLRVTIPNPDKALRPGMYARGAITTEHHSNVVIVPIDVLVPRSLGAGFDTTEVSTGIATSSTTLPPESAFVLGSDKTAVDRNVEVGIVNGDYAEVTSGLEPGDLIVVKGQGQLNPGDPLTPKVVDLHQADQDASGGATNGS